MLLKIKCIALQMTNLLKKQKKKRSKSRQSRQYRPNQWQVHSLVKENQVLKQRQRTRSHSRPNLCLRNRTVSKTDVDMTFRLMYLFGECTVVGMKWVRFWICITGSLPSTPATVDQRDLIDVMDPVRHIAAQAMLQLNVPLPHEKSNQEE